MLSARGTGHSQLLSKFISNKLTVSSTKDTFLENQIFIDVFLIEHDECAAIST